MKKRIVIVDDRPWKMKESVQELQKKQIVFDKVIYYPNDMLDKEEQNELMEEFKMSTGLEIVQVNKQMEFVEQMDELYCIPDIVFFMDYDLKGDMSGEDFFVRINVKYALSRDREQKKIWFYTSGPRDIKGLLRENFPDNIIGVPKFFDGQLYWDEEQVKAAVGE